MYAPNTPKRIVALRMAASIGFFLVVIYPIVISPMIDASKYREIQHKARENIVKENIQPGNMRVWSNPFEPINDVHGK